MTLFEIIILGLIYIFCVAFSGEVFLEIKCNIFERFLLFLLILIIAPLFTISMIGGFIADMINKSIK